MYKILIITTKSASVHTVVADFDSSAAAEAAIIAITESNGNDKHYLISVIAKRLYTDPSAPRSAWE
jgi:hypothetical protein